MEDDQERYRDAVADPAVADATRRILALSDEQWAALKRALGEPGRVRPGSDGADRRFVEAALSVMTGRCYWTDLPAEEFGNWASLYRRNRRWMASGVWRQALRNGALPPAWSQPLAQYAQRQEQERTRRRTRKRQRLLLQE